MRMPILLLCFAVITIPVRIYGITFEQVQHQAEKGDVMAMDALGYMYHNGAGGVQRDEAKALQWYMKAAERGHSTSQCRIAWAYLTGNGVAKDKRIAAMWYEKAASKGDAVAQFNLGVMYEQPLFSTGEEATGVPRDYVKAAELYQKSAVQGFANAQLNLATMFEKGIGVPQSNVKAFEWYLKAAENGLADAQMLVAYGYASGGLVQKDEVRAYAWYNLAAAVSDKGFTSKKDAQKERDEIEKRLTAAQLIEGQKLSGDLMAKMPKK